MNYHKRLKELQNLLKEKKLDSLIIDSPIDLLYLTGLSLSLGRLFIDRDKAKLFVDGRYIEECQKNSPFPVENSSDRDFISYLRSLSHIETIAFDSAFTSYRNYSSLKDKIREHPDSQLQLIPLENPTKLLRNIKEKEEITLLKNSAALCAKGFDYACSLLKEGVSEIELANEIEIFWKKRGSEKPSFSINVSFGKNSSMPHHKADATSLKKGDAVLMDIGVSLEEYQSDMTRVIFFGSPHPELEKIYHIVRQAQEKALDMCRPGIALGDLDSFSRKIIEESGYGEYYNHSLGHGIGLETHEFPAVKDAEPYRNFLLAPGMVFTVEPGIYLPNLGGVRIEDTIVVVEDGYENLTNRPKDLSIKKFF